MSTIGKGLFRSFQNGESINFLGYDITSLRRAFNLKSFLAVPQNSTPMGGLPGGGTLLVDSDGDGLPDVLEAQLGTDPLNPDTDGDGFSNLLEYRFRTSGFDPLNPDDADCALPDDRIDTDGDGVLDCEERFLGTSRYLADSDADGIPDGVELRAGTDPTHADVIDDTDQDGTSNQLKVLAHNNPEPPTPRTAPSWPSATPASTSLPTSPPRATRWPPPPLLRHHRGQHLPAPGPARRPRPRRHHGRLEPRPALGGRGPLRRRRRERHLPGRLRHGPLLQ